MHTGKRFFLVSVGGSGMMPLAMILAGRGAIVEGSDRGLDQGRVPAKFAALEALGIRLHPQDGSGIVGADQTVVASAAVEPMVADMVRAADVGAARMTRPELLSQLFNASAQPIGVAGTSGTTSNNSAIAFPAATADWGTVVAVGIFDASTGGNLLFFGSVTSQSVPNGVAYSFAISQLSCQLDN